MTTTEEAVVRIKEWLFYKLTDSDTHSAALTAFLEDIATVLALAEAYQVVTKEILTGDGRNG